MNRKCSQCQNLKPTSDFYKHKLGRDGYRAECKECSKSFKSQTPQKILDRVQKNRIRNRQFMWDFYCSHPCVDCGEDDPIVLELDHVRGEKVAGVSQLAHNTRSLKVIQEEINKCDVVCSNCHRRRTAKTQDWYRELVTDNVTTTQG